LEITYFPYEIPACSDCTFSVDRESKNKTSILGLDGPYILIFGQISNARSTLSLRWGS